MSRAKLRLYIPLILLKINGAEGENRTRTLFPKPDFESGASTSSATPAYLFS